MPIQRASSENTRRELRMSHRAWMFCAALLAAPATALAVEPGLGIELSREFLRLPETNFTFTFNNVVNLAPNAVPSKDVNHDGSLLGTRIDLAYGTRTTLFGLPLIAGLKGYFSEHSGAQSSSCTPLGSTSACAHMPLFDPNATTQQIAFLVPPARASETTALSARTWGVALEGQSLSQRLSFGTLAWKSGIGYRHLATALSLQGSNTLSTPYTLDESSNTGYLGGFFGALLKAPLAPGLTATLDGEAGLYWAHTAYTGSYSQTRVVNIPTVNVTQALALEHDFPALIASLKLGLEQDFGPIRAGVFVRAEYYSYAPSMAYNDVDRLAKTCAVSGCGGSNDGTSIANGQMLSATFGARVTVPFGP